LSGADFYGIQRVLLRYAGLPDLRAFPYAVQHGWQHAASRYEADHDPQEIWAWSTRIGRDMARYFPSERIRVVGSPYLYLPPLPSDRPAIGRDGAVYVLPHSSHFTKVGFLSANLLDLLSDIRRKEGRCDAMVYYLDVSPQLCALLKSANIAMVMNGGLWTSTFLENCRRNLRLYRCLYYSAFGSAVLFARHEGLQVFYIDLVHRLVQSENLYVNELQESSAFEPVGKDLEQDDEIGSRHVLPPDQLRSLIIRGMSQGPHVLLAKRACMTLFCQWRDYFRNVRSAEALVAGHNSGLHPAESRSARQA
jgi:hypothetical protein